MIPASFFGKDAATVARGLLGMQLLHETREGTTAGIIVETEAYHEDDPASHSHNGKTERNSVMFGPAGRAYVYFTYGMHHCFNIVTGPDAKGEAVLIRALEPTAGIPLMQRRRGRKETEELCNGPAKLVQAMGITKEHNGATLTGNLRIELGNNPRNVVQTTRIGIKKGTHLPLRFYTNGNRYVSKR